MPKKENRNVTTFKTLLNVDTHAMVVKPSRRQAAILEEKAQEVVRDSSYDPVDQMAMQDFLKQLERA